MAQKIKDVLFFTYLTDIFKIDVFFTKIHFVQQGESDYEK